MTRSAAAAMRVRRPQPASAGAGLIRRRLATRLQQARGDADLTQRMVAKKLGWSLSKVLRIEGAQVGPSETDVVALSRLYRTDAATVRELRGMAAASRRLPFRGYRRVVPDTFLNYLALEAAATRIIQWAPVLVPELLQSGAYAHAIAETFDPAGAPADVVARRTVLTAARRTALLEQPLPPQLVVILDQAVIERLALGPDVMIDQLPDLRQYVDHPQVTIRVAGYASGFHLGLRGAFTILEFPPPDPPLLFVHAEPYTAIEVTEQLATYEHTVKTLMAAATDPAQLGEVLDGCLGLTPSNFVGAA